jgi:hypothetical protein
MTYYDLMYVSVKNTWCHLIPWRQEPHLRRFPRLLGCLSGIWLRVLDWTGHGLIWPAHLSRNSFLKPCGNNPRVPRGHDWITCGYLWFVADQHLLRWMLSWYLLEFLWPSNSFWYPNEMLHLFGDDTQALCIWYAMQSGCLWPMAIRLVFRRTGPRIEVNHGSWGVLKTCDAIYSNRFINLSFY